MQKSYKDTYPNISIIILINLRSLNHQFKEIYLWLFLHFGEMEIYKNKLQCFQGQGVYTYFLCHKEITNIKGNARVWGINLQPLDFLDEPRLYKVGDLLTC